MMTARLFRMPAIFRRDLGAASGAHPIPLSTVVRWLARRWLNRIGTAGVVAVGLFTMLLPFYFSTVLPLQHRFDVARSGAAALQRRVGMDAPVAGGGRLTPVEQLAEFYRIFPAEANSPLWLGKVFACATSRGLHLDQGEYDAKPDKVGRLLRFRMTLPVKGEYAQIRKFLTALPTEVPVVALEQVQFQRQKIGDSMVDAKLKLVLYLERTP